MKTQHAIKQVGSVRKLAALLDLSTAAIYAWGDDVPELRAFQLQALRPKLFPPAKVKTK